MNINELRFHFVKLANDMQVEVKFGSKFRSSKGRKEIEIKGLNSESDYISALHELGHQSTQNSPIWSGKPYEYLGFGAIRVELEAWKWAIKHALTFTEEMRKEIKNCLWSYFRGFVIGNFHRNATYEEYRRELESVMERLSVWIRLSKVAEKGV